MNQYDRLPLTFERRFAYKVYERGDCWEWRGRQRPLDQYGTLCPVGSQTIYAHRVAYEMAKGVLPPGMTVDHLCKHPWCVRPSHLESVSMGVNCLRGNGPTAQNARTLYCKHGHVFDIANTYHRPDATTHRQCRTCNNERRRVSWRDPCPSLGQP